MRPQTLHDHLLIVWHRRHMVGLTVLAAGLSALLVSILMRPTYEASSEFFINADLPRTSPYRPNAAEPAPMAAPLVAQEFEKWYSGLLESAAVREKVVRFAVDAGVPPVAIDSNRLRSAVDVQFNRKHIVRVRVRDADPARAALIANAYPRALDRFVRETADSGGSERGARLANIMNDLIGRLLEAHERREALLAGKAAVDVRDDMQALAQRRNQLETQIADTEGRLKSVDARLAEGEKQLNRETQAGEASGGATWGNTVPRLQKEVADLETDLAAARAEFDGEKGDLHPRVRNLKARLAAKREQLKRETDAVKGSAIRTPDSWEEHLRREAGTLRQDQRALAAELGARNLALREVQQRIAGLAALRAREQASLAEIGRIERMIENVALRQRDLQYGNDAEPLVVVQSAVVPVSPAWPVPVWNVLVAVALGLVGGLYLAFLYDYIARVHALGRLRGQHAAASAP